MTSRFHLLFGLLLSLQAWLFAGRSPACLQDGVEAPVVHEPRAPAELTSVERKDAVALVKKAIAYFKAHGRKALVAEVSRTKSTLRDGSRYVFVYDMQGHVVAHGQFARLAGYDLSGFHDPAGKAYIQERIKLAKEKGSGWQDYVFMNPDTKKWEPKTAYIERCEDLIFGCGVYRSGAQAGPSARPSDSEKRP